MTMKAKLVISGRNANLASFFTTNKETFRGSMKFSEFVEMFEGESVRKIVEIVYDLKITCNKERGEYGEK